MKDILVIGTLPPPIGGVTIHVQRLCDQLEKSEVSFQFIDFKRNTRREILKAFLKNKRIHLHSSNVHIQLLFAIFCLITTKKLILTYHGNIGRYGIIKNTFNHISIKMAKIPIVINKQSYHIAKKINKKTKLVSAFLPPVHIKPLDESMQKKILSLRENCRFLFCTNASNVNFDINKREIYQITNLVKLFNDLPDFGLIVSDPTGNYIDYLENNKILINPNILFISYEHDFNSVIKESNCMIRYTTTDGDSLSVKEALSAGKQVIATNVVDRPEQVILVNDDIIDLKNKVTDFSLNQGDSFDENGFDNLYEIYKCI